MLSFARAHNRQLMAACVTLLGLQSRRLAVFVQLKHRYRKFKEAKRLWLSSLLLPLATFQARLSLKARQPLSILIDSSVLGHAVIHETGWISTGTKKWGHIDVDTGYMARIPVHSPDNDSRTYNEVRYLAPIAHLHRNSNIKLVTSAELFAEQFRQPMGRFAGYGWADYHVFKGAHFDSVDGLHLDVNDPREAQRERIASCDAPLFRELLSLLGEKSSQDAWHIYTAEKHGLFAFLHIDFPLAAKFQQNKNKPPIRDLKTRVLLPSEFSKLFHILPVNTNLLGKEKDGFFPMRDDLHMPDQRRRSRKDYK